MTFLDIIMISIGVVVSLAMTKVFPITGSYWIIGVLIFFVGIINVLINVPVATLFQKLVPNDFRGRFYGVFGTLSQGLIPLAYVLLIIGGISFLLMVMGMARSKVLRTL